MERKRFREWLEEREVYVRFLTALLLSAMAIFLSYEANRISRRQLSVLEREAVVVEAKEFPRIGVKVTWSSGNGYGVWLKNEGGPVEWVEPRLCFEFLALQQRDDLRIGRIVVLPLALFGGFQQVIEDRLDASWLIAPNAPKETEIWGGPREQRYFWWSKAEYMLDSCLREISERGLTATLHVLIEVSYMNILGEELTDVFYWTEMYMFTRGSNAVRLEKREGPCALHLSSACVNEILEPRVGGEEVVFLDWNTLTEIPPSVEAILEIWQRYKD